LGEFDPVIEKNISALIPQQFPDFYREEGPTFVEFVKTYYKWLESSNNSLFHSRRIFDYKDIDNTTDDFLLFFKEKYLTQIQLTSETNTTQLLKHSLDLYRSKGTERGLDLLFRAVFGVPTSVYYPGSDIFRLSDGKWVVPQYLEVSLSEHNVLLVNKQIEGLDSGATAFVQNVIRRTVKGKLIDILYISAINGVFKTGEHVKHSVLTVPQYPVIIGSFTDIIVSSSGTGAGFSVGDIVTIISDFGEQATARVVSISDTTGLVSLDLLFGGYGYTANAEVLISEKVLTVDTLSIHSNTEYFGIFETVTQPLANINYLLATGAFVVGENVFTYFGGGAEDGAGKILAITTINSTAGELMITVFSGNMENLNFFNTANVITAEQDVTNGYFDYTATANVIGWNSDAVLDLEDVTGAFVTSEEIVQVTAVNNFVTNGVSTFIRNVIGSNLTITLANTNWQFTFQTGLRVLGLTSGASGNVQNIAVDVGVVSVTNSFVNTVGAYFFGNDTNANGEITVIGQGTGAALALDTFIYTETVSLGNDFISGHVTTALNEDPWATPISFPANSSANLECIIDDCLGYENVAIGQIASLTGLNKGTGYTKGPVIRIHEPWTYPFDERGGSVIEFENATGDFAIGEEITQSASSGRGEVVSVNTTHMFVDRLRLLDADDFVNTTNSTTLIVGTDSAVQANVLSVIDDPTRRYIGLNALIDNEVQTQSGAITDLDVIDSGFGYVNGEIISFAASDTIQGEEGSGTISLQTHGEGAGFYKKKGGFLSDQKRLFDGDFYQEYSYQIKSSLTLDFYIDMLKQVIHVAGTKPFGKLLHKAFANTPLNANTAAVGTFTPTDFWLMENGVDFVLQEGGTDIIYLERYT